MSKEMYDNYKTTVEKRTAYANDLINDIVKMALDEKVYEDSLRALLNSLFDVGGEVGMNKAFAHEYECKMKKENHENPADGNA